MSNVNHWLGYRLWQLDEVREMIFEICIFFWQKRMDSQQEAFIHPSEPCEARFFMKSLTLFYVFRTV